jgi:hypothetical protein
VDRQSQERSLSREAIRERLEALRERAHPVTQHEEPAAGLPAHGQGRGREHERTEEARQAPSTEAIRDRLRGVLDRAKPVVQEREAPGAEPGTGAVPGAVPQPDLLATVVERARDAMADEPSFAMGWEARAFRAEMERRFDPGTLQRLGRGEAAALAEVADSRLDALCLARAWLDSKGEPPRSEARMSLVYALSDAQIDAKRERLAHEEDGHDWGL